MTSDFRPPYSSSEFTATATAVAAIGAYMPEELGAERDAALGRAVTWLAASWPRSTEDAAFRVMGNDALFVIAERLPRSPAELSGIPGVGRDIAERRGHEILAAVEAGLAVPEDRLPHYPKAPRHRPDPAFEARLERL
jgi:ribonuclease D